MTEKTKRTRTEKVSRPPKDLPSPFLNPPDLSEDTLRYRNILDSMEEAYIEVDLKGHITFTHNRPLFNLGYSTEELLKMSFRELVDKETGKRTYDAYHEIFTTGKPLQGFEYVLIGRNGEMVDAELSAFLLRDEQRRPSGFGSIIRDITKRKQAERALQESEEKYRHILESMEESYVELDLQGNYIFFNDALCRIIGYSREELKNLNYRQINLPEDHQRIYEEFNKVYRTGKPSHSFFTRIKCKDGKIRHRNQSISLRCSPEGKPIGFRLVSKDITEKLQTEQKARESEEKYLSVLERMEETYLELDLKGNYIFFNDALCRVLGYSREELQNINYRAINRPEDHHRIFEDFNEIYRTGRTRRFLNHSVICKDGSIRNLEMAITLLRSPSGEPIGFGGIGRDVTERFKSETTIKNRERHLRLLTDNISDAIWTMDFDLRFTYVSPSVLHLTGFTPEELVGLHLKSFVSPKLYAERKRILAEALIRESKTHLRDDEVSKTFEMQIMRKDGSLFWAEIMTDFNRDEQGKPFEIVGITRDISARKKAEEDLRKKERRYRMLAENVNDVVWIIGLDLSFKYASPSQVKLLGWTRERAKNITVRDVVSPESLDRIIQVMADELALETGGESFDPNRSRTIEVEAYAQDGHSVWLELTGTFNRDANGKPTEILAVGRNITQRRNIERALAENEKRFRMMAENVHDVVWVISKDLKLTYVSPSNVKAAGYTPEEAINTPLEKLVAPESLEMGIQIVADELAIEASGEPADPNRSRTVELEAYAKGGHPIWLEVTGTFNRDENGKATEILAVGRNITQRKNIERALAQNEKRYRMLAENVHDVVWIIDLDLRLKYASPSTLRLTGYTPEEVLALSVEDVSTPETLETVCRVVSEELALEGSGKPFDPNRSITLEVEAIAKGGRTYWLEITGTFNRDENGKPTEILAVGRDITQRRQMARALRESEKRYRMIAENMNDMIWVMGLDMKFTYVSPSSVRITGYTPEETISTPLVEMLTPESYSNANKKLAEELALEASGQPFDPNRAMTIEIEAIRKDSSTLWLEITGTFNRDNNGAVKEVLLVGRNITAKKRTEKALAETQRLYRVIVENIQDSVSLLDLDFNYLYVTPSEVRITGYKPEELMKIPPQEQTTPESYALMESIFAEEIAREFSDEPVDPNRSRTIEVEVYHKNGGKIWVELVLTFTRDESGKPLGILISARDITERRKIQDALRESENRYRSILDSIQEIIWTTDLNLQTTYVSPSCFQVTGYTPDEAKEIPLPQLLTPESFEFAQKLLAQELAIESSGDAIDPYRTRTLEQEMYHKDSGTVLLEVTATFTRDKDETANGLLLAGRDITARKQAEEEREKLQKQLIQAQKMESVGRLAGGVAHDFNNMLSVILGYVDIAKGRLAKHHPVLKDIGEIEKAALRSRDITTQLLAFSRKQIITPVVIDLNELVTDTQKSLIRLIGEDIQLSYHPGEDLWAIRFDPSQIEQILINLAVNARDAMPEGGKLTIETENVVLDSHYCEAHIGFKPGQYVRLNVSDNGTGMDRETVQYIFEPFFTTKEEGKGTGLGLATVYGIVKQNDGYVNVYSEPGQGTTFAVYFPRTLEEKGPEQEPDEEQPASGEGHILLVEDDAMVLEITKEMLETLNYTVTVAKDPLDAISICEKDPSLDLVITDVVMPVMKGKELRDRLEKIRPDIKVLFMSGYTANVIAQHGVLEEGVHFIQKPFTIRSLGKKVAEVLAFKN